MQDMRYFLDQIDAHRWRRAKELSELKVRMREIAVVPQFDVRSKATIVLTYSQWEGFYNDCITLYIAFLRNIERRVCDISWPMLIGLLDADFKRLRDKHHSRKALVDFTGRIQSVITQDFSEFDQNVIAAKSNLDFDKLRRNFDILKIDYSRFQEWRLRIDKELVGWRHGIAHGNEPDLSSLNIDEHVRFAQRMLLILADLFQEKISEVVS